MSLREYVTADRMELEAEREQARIVAFREKEVVPLELLIEDLRDVLEEAVRHMTYIQTYGCKSCEECGEEHSDECFIHQFLALAAKVLSSETKAPDAGITGIIVKDIGGTPP